MPRARPAMSLLCTASVHACAVRRLSHRADSLRGTPAKKKKKPAQPKKPAEKKNVSLLLRNVVLHFFGRVMRTRVGRGMTVSLGTLPEQIPGWSMICPPESPVGGNDAGLPASHPQV